MADRSRDGSPDLLVFERQARARGCRIVAGVDEVGRGPLAGPVVAAAVILPPAGVDLPLDDSKRLDATRREDMAAALEKNPAVTIGIGLVSARQIDRINILNATREAMIMALDRLGLEIDLALVDGLRMPRFPVTAEFIVKGDAKSASIAAASIVAKVHRDRLMQELDIEFPGYGFARHKGYGTREHLDALLRLGPSNVHRQSFAPVARLRDQHTQLELPFG